MIYMTADNRFLQDLFMEKERADLARHKELLGRISGVEERVQSLEISRSHSVAFIRGSRRFLWLVAGVVLTMGAAAVMKPAILPDSFQEPVGNVLDSLDPNGDDS